jgi:hypothetical protein
MKPKLILVGRTFLNSESPHHMPLFQQYFDIESYDPLQTYSKQHTFLYRSNDQYDKIAQYKGVGCKFIAEAVWELEFGCDDIFDDQTIGLINNKEHPRTISVPKWFWFEEHHSQWGKKPVSLPHSHTREKKFLMQIGDPKSERLSLWGQLEARGLLKDSLHSFLAKGLGLEGPVTNYQPNNPPFPQRNYVADWYNQTVFTVILEYSYQQHHNIINPIFITEKTFKPIMYGHPFILYGNTHSLKSLKDWGFETYDNWFDESYDDTTDLHMKIEHICDEIARPTREYDDVTKQKINHNVERFWNRELVHQLMVDEIIKPLLNFINS